MILQYMYYQAITNCCVYLKGRAFMTMFLAYMTSYFMYLHNSEYETHVSCGTLPLNYMYTNSLLWTNVFLMTKYSLNL